jgi:hypothetical protein
MLNDNRLSFKLLDSHFFKPQSLFFHKGNLIQCKLYPHHISCMFNASGWWILDHNLFLSAFFSQPKFIPQVTDSATMFLSELSLSLSEWERERETYTHTHTQMCTQFAAGTVAICNHHNLNTKCVHTLQQVQLQFAFTTIWIQMCTHFAAGTVAFCTHHNFWILTVGVSPTLPYTKEKQLFVTNEQKVLDYYSSSVMSQIMYPRSTNNNNTLCVWISSNPCTIYKAKKLYNIYHNLQSQKII